MRTPNLGSVAYIPSPVPATSEELPKYLELELQRIASALTLLAAGHFDKTYVAPTKPRDGDTRLADGTSWNPGAGAGVYTYYGGAWSKLG